MPLQSLLALLCLLLAMPATAMSFEEAAGHLGSADEALAQEAQSVLRRGGWNALATLEAVIFTGEEPAVERAKHCRRCILYRAAARELV